MLRQKWQTRKRSGAFLDDDLNGFFMRNEFPEEDIDKSLRTKCIIAYKAVVDDVIVGGAVVVIDEETQLNHLNFLYVKYRTQSKGIGIKMLDEIEKLHPQTKVRETCTPYFEKRNIHFYVNKCEFHI